MSKTPFRLISVKKGSFPTLEGDSHSDSFFIIKQGQVLEVTSSLPERLSREELLCTGDFFGIISCMARRPRLHTTQVLEDSQFIEVRRTDFKNLLEDNTPIALKIIRSFSRKLRFYDNIFSKLSFMMDTDRDISQLFEIGEYYFGKKMFAHHAAYAYERFLELAPHHTLAGQARERINIIRRNYSWDIKPRTEDNLLHFDDNRIVFLEKEPGEKLYIIQQGEVKISRIFNRQELLLNVLKQGDIFGEMAILENKPRNANALTEGQVSLLPVTRSSFESLVHIHPELAGRIIELLSDRIWFIHQQIATILISDPASRLFDALYIHLLKDRVEIDQVRPHTFNLNWEDLLKFTGLQGQSGRLALESTLMSNPDFREVDGHIFCKNIQTIISKISLQRKRIELKRGDEIYIM